MLGCWRSPSGTCTGTFTFTGRFNSIYGRQAYGGGTVTSPAVQLLVMVLSTKPQYEPLDSD